MENTGGIVYCLWRGNMRQKSEFNNLQLTGPLTAFVLIDRRSDGLGGALQALRTGNRSRLGRPGHELGCEGKHLRDRGFGIIDFEPS
jgi:hypothetical protein